jgi:DNA gyrase subunit B
MAKKEYSDSSIQCLSDREAVRTRFGMYIFNNTTEGYHQLFSEILDNGIDEYLAGYCNSIRVEISKDKTECSVQDNGRGIPQNIHPVQKIPTCDVIFTKLHSGSKFDKDSYKVSGGLNGVGASVSNFLSVEMKVDIWRDGKQYFRHYINSKPTKKELELAGKCGKKEHGTKVWFKPDTTIFKNCTFNKETIQNRLKELSYLNPKLKLTLFWEEDNTTKEYYNENGLIDYFKVITKDKKLIHEPIQLEGEVAGCSIKTVFAFEEEYDTQIKTYVNNIQTQEGGVHNQAFLSSFSKVVYGYAESKLKKLDLSINKSDLEGLNLVLSILVPEPQFGGQTKTKLNNEELRKPLGDWFQEQFEKVLKKNSIIVDKIVNNILSTDAARKAKDSSRKKTLLETGTLSSKLKNCSNKNPTLSEIFFVEGSSAAGSVIDQRDRKYQAVLPLRGKVLNVGGSKSLNQILENKEISELISALGVTFTKEGISTDKLKYNKIILIFDGDEDGGHILCLILTLFYKFMKKIIDKGYLYICEMPLFKVTHGNNSKYLKNNAELEEYKKHNRILK